MKREICCEEGAKYWRKLIGKYEGEHIKVVEGILREDCVCDSCVSGHPLKVGEKAFCVSIWTDISKNSYYEWEAEFLESIKA